jgi:rhomboid protease GluP
MNVLLGAGWCRAVERALGTLRFLGLWLGSALAASAASLLLQDVVAVGASGAIFGMVGAELAFHRRALPGWRAFLDSRATRALAASLGAWTLVALLANLHIDHAAHTGGLLFGAAGAWAATRPTPRWRDLTLLALALLLACAAAAWPRRGLSRLGAEEVRRTIHEALRREDRPAAAAGLRRASEAGLSGDDLDYYGALLDIQEERLEEAVERLRPLVKGSGPLHDEARRALAGVARVLGYRLYTGDGAAKDAQAGLRWLVEACQLGDRAACRDSARIVGEPER